MPVVVIPVKAGINTCVTQRRYRLSGLRFIRQEEREKCRRVSFWIGDISKTEFRKLGQGIFDGFFMQPLFFQNEIELFKLSQSNCCIQLTDTEICSQNWMAFETSVIADVVMSVISICICKGIKFFIIGDNGTALTACNRFDRIE